MQAVKDHLKNLEDYQLEEEDKKEEDFLRVKKGGNDVKILVRYIKDGNIYIHDEAQIKIFKDGGEIWGYSPDYGVKQMKESDFIYLN